MIAEFYRDCDIFLTGGSGAIGKATIEKLLRSCSVKRIYVLLREKNGLTAEQRLDKMKMSKNFRVLRDAKPNELDKLVAVPGDLELQRLGINSEYAKIMENVSIVFHAGGSTPLDTQLKITLKLNVRATLESLKFAETLKNLKIFMHVSTFFSNPNVKIVEEKLYPSPVDWRMCLKLLDNESLDDVYEVMTKKLIKGFPNTYTFTKNLAERIVNEFHHRIPVAIFRPSMVVCALKEPEPGFPPTFMGFTGLLALAGAGVLKSVYCANDLRLDLTPIDLGVKTMLVYAVRATQLPKSKLQESVKIYTFSSSKLSTDTFRDFVHIVHQNGIWASVPYEKSLLLPLIRTTPCSFLHKLGLFWYQLLPSIVIDGLLIAFGRKPVLMKIQRKIFVSFLAMQHCMFNNYDSSGFSECEEVINMTEGTEFSISSELRLNESRVARIDSLMHMNKKIRDVLLNEDETTITKCRIILKVKEIFYNGVRIVLAFFFLRSFFRLIIKYIDTNYAYNK